MFNLNIWTAILAVYVVIPLLFPRLIMLHIFFSFPEWHALGEFERHDPPEPSKGQFSCQILGGQGGSCQREEVCCIWQTDPGGSALPAWKGTRPWLVLAGKELLNLDTFIHGFDLCNNSMQEFYTLNVLVALVKYQKSSNFWIAVKYDVVSVIKLFKWAL